MRACVVRSSHLSLVLIVGVTETRLLANAGGSLRHIPSSASGMSDDEGRQGGVVQAEGTLTVEAIRQIICEEMAASKHAPPPSAGTDPPGTSNPAESHADELHELPSF